MKVSSLGVGVVCLTLLAASIASAQQRGPRPGGGAGPAMGARMGGGLDAASLLRSEQVRKEIGITEEQEKALAQWRDAQRPTRPERPEGEARPEDREARMQQMREQWAARAAQSREELAKILKPEQMKRLAQIRAQQEGPAVLRREEIQKQLKLTDAQKADLNKIAEEAGEKMREAFQAARGPDADREQVRAKMQELRAETQKKSMAVLTAEQRKQLGEEVMGKPFELDRASLMPQRPEGARGPQRPGEGERRARPEGERRARPEGERRARPEGERRARPEGERTRGDRGEAGAAGEAGPRGEDAQEGSRGKRSKEGKVEGGKRVKDAECHKGGKRVTDGKDGGRRCPGAKK